MTAGLAHPGGLAALAALGPVAHIRSPAPAKSQCEEGLRAPTHRGFNIPVLADRSELRAVATAFPRHRLRHAHQGARPGAEGGPRYRRALRVPRARSRDVLAGCLKTAASPLAERPPSASVVGIGQHRLDGTDEARAGLAPTREPDPRDALKNAFAPTQPTTLELCVNVYNLHRDFTARAPLLMCALLVEVPPPTLPYKMPAAWKRAPERHRSWRVAGSTEPTRAACNASCVRFAVPVVVDKLIGGQRTLENKKAVIAVYRIPDADEQTTRTSPRTRTYRSTNGQNSPPRDSTSSSTSARPSCGATSWFARCTTRRSFTPTTRRRLKRERSRRR